jgi:S-adenosylmethionine synthetase
MKRVTDGAQDAVIVNGYATRETRERLPRALVYAHAIARRIDDLRRADPAFSWLRPDGKVQVVMEKDQVRAVTVLASHAQDISPREVQNALLERAVRPIVGNDDPTLYVNPLGSFIAHGFAGDSGVSGRKSAVDTYGGLVPHGDGSLSGKDPLKASRAGAYMARYAARHLVEQGLAESALITVAYTLGRAEPILLEARGMGEKSRGAKMDLGEVVKRAFDFRPEAIAERLDLRRPIYRHTATYGHFGRLGLPWEEQANA